MSSSVSALVSVPVSAPSWLAAFFAAVLKDPNTEMPEQYFRELQEDLALCAELLGFLGMKIPENAGKDLISFFLQHLAEMAEEGLAKVDFKRPQMPSGYENRPSVNYGDDIVKLNQEELNKLYLLRGLIVQMCIFLLAKKGCVHGIRLGTEMSDWPVVLAILPTGSAGSEGLEIAWHFKSQDVKLPFGTVDIEYIEYSTAEKLRRIADYMEKFRC